jgi:hypothetical protein
MKSNTHTYPDSGVSGGIVQGLLVFALTVGASLVVGKTFSIGFDPSDATPNGDTDGPVSVVQVRSAASPEEARTPDASSWSGAPVPAKSSVAEPGVKSKVSSHPKHGHAKVHRSHRPRGTYLAVRGRTQSR